MFHWYFVVPVAITIMHAWCGLPSVLWHWESLLFDVWRVVTLYPVFCLLSSESVCWCVPRLLRCLVVLSLLSALSLDEFFIVRNTSSHRQQPQQQMLRESEWTGWRSTRVPLSLQTLLSTQPLVLPSIDWVSISSYKTVHCVIWPIKVIVFNNFVRIFCIIPGLLKKLYAEFHIEVLEKDNSRNRKQLFGGGGPDLQKSILRQSYDNAKVTIDLWVMMDV